MLHKSKPVQLSVGTIVLFSHFGKVTGLLASYDFFSVSGEKTTALFLLTFQKGTKSPREASLQFYEDENFVSLTLVAVIKCLQKYVAGPCFHMWGSEFCILGTVLFSKVFMRLACADCMMTLTS
jgi:hypothetical protein